MSGGKDFIVAVVCFDHRIGPELEFVYPPPEDHHDVASWQDMKFILPLLALPSRHEAAADKSTSTCFFFHVPPSNYVESAWKGVAYYDVIHPHATHALDDDTLAKYSRGAIQKSIVVLSKTPYQAYVKVKLDAMAHQFFAQTSFGDCGLLVELHDALCSIDLESLSWPQLHIGLPLQSLVRAVDVHLAGLLRLLLVQGRIVFYSQSPQVVSSSVLAFLSLLPGGIHSTTTSPHAHRYRLAKYGLPLAIADPTHMFPIEPYLISSYAASMLQKPAGQGGFLVGSCDPICLKFHATLDAIVDLDAQCVHFHSPRATAAATLGPSTVDWFNNILTHVAALLGDESGTGNIEWTGSDGWIRQQVQLYMETFLTDVAADSLTRRRTSFWDLVSSPPVSRLAMEYNDAWIQLWFATFNYSQWLKSHRLHRDTQRQLAPVPDSGKATYTYPNGDVYDGEFAYKKRHGRGKYAVANTSYSYDGQWQADLRHGVGTLTSMQGTYHGAWVLNEKSGYGEFANALGTYKGSWRRNVYHGSGVLVQNGLEYDGEFVDGKFDGLGKCSFVAHAEWKRYRGEWRRGLFHGCGTLEFINGDVYVGDFEAGKRHGQGTLTSTSGNVYTGQWKDGMQHGHGSSFSHTSKETKEGRWVRNQVVEGRHEEWVILYPNKDKYIGTCQGGRPWGRGICRYANGSVYTGEWVDGLREGLGIFCDHNGRTFEGEWRNSQPWKEQSVTPYVEVSLADHNELATDEAEDGATVPPNDGVHVFVYGNGDTYSGRFRKGRRHGVGKYTSKLTRHIYDGEWDMDQRHGKGILTSGSSDFIYDGEWRRDTKTGHGTCVIRGAESYTGSWDEDRFHGRGTYTDADGSVYEGEFHRGLRHGMGKLTTADQQVYQGEFQKGERCGIGTCTYANGDVYTGEWKANQRHGEGTMEFKSGDRYVGQWHEDRRHGVGCLTDARGTTREGMWGGDAPLNGDWHIKFATGSSYNGQCVQGKPHGSGVCKYTNGDVYSGEWVSGVRSGWGVCVFANGDVFEGEWTSNHVSLNGKGTLTLANGTVHAYAQ